MKDEMYSAEGNQRAQIAVFLGVACMIIAAVLTSYNPAPTYRLKNLAHADSLVRAVFDEHALDPRAIRSRMIRIDTLFYRTNYTVNVPRDFKKTSFHHSLFKKIEPYGMTTYGTINLSERSMTVHILYTGSIISTVQVAETP